jgi:hypothetical protein
LSILLWLVVVGVHLVAVALEVFVLALVYL